MTSADSCDVRLVNCVVRICHGLLTGQTTNPDQPWRTLVVLMYREAADQIPPRTPTELDWELAGHHQKFHRSGRSISCCMEGSLLTGRLLALHQLDFAVSSTKISPARAAAREARSILEIGNANAHRGPTRRAPHARTSNITLTLCEVPSAQILTANRS